LKGHAPGITLERMIACADVHYTNTHAIAACILFRDWSDAHPDLAITERVETIRLLRARPVFIAGNSRRCWRFFRNLRFARKSSSSTGMSGWQIGIILAWETTCTSSRRKSCRYQRNKKNFLGGRAVQSIRRGGVTVRDTILSVSGGSAELQALTGGSPASRLVPLISSSTIRSTG
jgi:hypothetical protein